MKVKEAKWSEIVFEQDELENLGYRIGIVAGEDPRVSFPISEDDKIRLLIVGDESDAQKIADRIASDEVGKGAFAHKKEMDETRSRIEEGLGI